MSALRGFVTMLLAVIGFALVCAGVLGLAVNYYPDVAAVIKARELFVAGLERALPLLPVAGNAESIAAWLTAFPWRYLVALVMIVICVLPLLYVISASLNPGGSLVGSNRLFRTVSGENFADLEARGFWTWLGNSLVVCTVTAIGTVLMGAAAAYAFSRFRFKGRYERMMAGIPVKLITHPQPGLYGAAAAFASEHKV